MVLPRVPISVEFMIIGRYGYGTARKKKIKREDTVDGYGRTNVN